MELDLKNLAVEDYKRARQNIYAAEEAEGKSAIVRALIEEAGKKLDAFEECWLKYKKDNGDLDSLKEASRNARDARILSTDALEKARSVDLGVGLRVVKIMFILVVALSGLYVMWHYVYETPWFAGYIWFEVVFFSLFGVLTNLTYSAAKHVLQKDFDRWHLGWYWSKIPQAPFITLAILLMLTGIEVETFGVPVDLGDAPAELIISFAYILGLFSRRAWELLEKIKDWIMPVKNSGG